MQEEARLHDITLAHLQETKLELEEVRQKVQVSAESRIGPQNVTPVLISVIGLDLRDKSHVFACVRKHLRI